MISGTSHRVLVVESDSGVSRMILLSLCTAGFEPVHASSGAAALRLLDSVQVEAVVIDPDLSDGLGGRVMDRLRGNVHSQSAIPWIVVSAQDEEDLKGSFGPTGSHFLAKPFDMWDLVRTLRRLIE